MEDLTPQLQDFADLPLDDTWTVKSAMHGLDGTAIRLDFQYHRRLPTDSEGIHPGDNYVELWWHASQDQYALAGPHITDMYCNNSKQVTAELYQALGETRALIERSRLIGEFGDIEGVGHATITRLHRKYGTAERVYEADPEPLLTIPHVTPAIVEEIQSQKDSPRHILAQADDSQIELGSNW